MIFFETLEKAVETLLLPLAVLCTGGYFLIAGKGFLFRLPLRRPRRLGRTLFPSSGGKRKKGGVSPLKAMLLALAGTLGIGNLSGVASAVAIGGSGALFWMLISSVAAMALKYAEILLAMKHRKKDGGRYHGGACLLLPPKWGKVFAVLTLFCSFAVGNSMQGAAAAKTAARAVGDSFGGGEFLPALCTGAFLSLLLLCTLSAKKGKKLFDLSVTLVPLMTGLYLLLSFGVLYAERAALPGAIASIFSAAFTPRAVGGGISGTVLAQSIRCGVLRGLISNEAGCGTAPMAHCEAENDSAAAQGWFGVLEVLVDTVLLCTLTGLVVLVGNSTAAADATADGMEILLTAFQGVYGEASGWFLTVAVFLFAFATMVTWSYYGCECLYFLGLERFSQGYRIIFALSAAVLALLPSAVIWRAADLAVALVTLLNCGMLWQKKYRTEIIEETRLFSLGLQ